MADLKELLLGIMVIFVLGTIFGVVAYIIFGGGAPVLIGISIGIMCGALYALEKY